MSRFTRRSFLAVAGLAGAGAAVALVATPQSTQPAPSARTGAADTRSRGYQVTEHVRRYYRTTRV